MIKDCLERNNVIINKFIIIQASSLREKLETMNINKKINSIVSIDIVNFYLLVSYQIIEKVVWYFAKGIKGKERETRN